MDFIQRTLAEKCLQDFGFSVEIHNDQNLLEFVNPVRKTYAKIQMLDEKYVVQTNASGTDCKFQVDTRDEIYFKLRDLVHKS